MAKRRKGPPKPITLLYGIVVLAAAAWLVVYWRGGCRKPELDKGKRAEQAGQWEEAASHYKDLLRRYPNDRDAATRITMIYCHRLRRPDDCIAWADKLREIYPSDERYRLAAGEGHLERGKRFMADGDRKNAETSLLRASELLPRSYDAADELWRLYEAAGEPDKAERWRVQRDALSAPPPEK